MNTSNRPVARTSAPWVAALVLFAGSGCNKEAGTGGDPPIPAVDMSTAVQPLKAEISLAPTQPGLDGALSTPTFDFTKMVDLWVRVKIPAAQMPAETVLKLQFISPKGSPFYEDNAAWSKDMAHPLMTTPGVDVALTAQKALKLADGSYALDRPIPVAGSAFDRYPQYGTWIVQASIDAGQPLLTTSFVLATPKR